MPDSTLLRNLRRQNKNSCAYYRGGCGDSPLLLIHGVGLSADCWQMQVEYLTADYTVFAVDLPGHGESVNLIYSLGKIEDFVSIIADFIQKEIGEPVTIIGHSLGALIALELAAHYSHLVNRAAALSAIYARDEDAQQAVAERATQLRQGQETDRLQLIEQTLIRWFGTSPSPQQLPLATQCRRWLQQTPATAYTAAYQVFSRYDATHTPLETLTQPLLYLTGGDDNNSTATMSQQMAAITPKGQAVIISGHGHMLQMSAPAQVNSVFRQWLSDNTI